MRKMAIRLSALRRTTADQSMKLSRAARIFNALRVFFAFWWRGAIPVCQNC